MNFEKGKLYHGFRLENKETIKELNSETFTFHHEKSGARLFYVHNDDDNKVFFTSFRTPPHDNTGIPHILEHSVLCGSRKFPTKEPFVELIKGSLNTFLNAITFSDKTLYPVASRNDKDFMNLMDVYLDAVFYPAIYSTPETLMQEGWHYELDDKDQPLTYKGVVYNEMKGAYSSPEQVLFQKIQTSLYPDTPYAYDSGGDPDFIPDLTQKKFLAFHKKYYHPSNSYIYLYGDGDILEHLNFINSYLKEFDKMDIDSMIPEQEPFEKLKSFEIEYSISKNESIKDKSYLSLNYSVGKCTDPFLYLAFDILEYMLLENPAAPLKKALLNAGIGKDIFGSYDSSILQPSFSIIAKDANLEDADKFKSIIEKTLKDLVENGIDKHLVEAAISHKEFLLREADYGGTPKGLFYGIKCMDSWLHDEDPNMHLYYEDTLSKVKKGLEKPLFEELIEKYILNNTHSSMVIIKPKPGLADENDKAISNHLQTYKNQLSNEELDDIVNNAKNLRLRQSTPDTPEALATIPMVELSDIKPKAEVLPLEEKMESGVKVLYSNIFTNSIAYLNLWFDMSAIPEDLLPYTGLLVHILGNISTKNLDYEELTNEISIQTGGIQYSNQALVKYQEDGNFAPKFLIKSKVLVDKMQKLVNLLDEIINRTIYSDVKRLKEIVQEARSRMEMVINQSGHAVALNRLSSYFTPAGKYAELNSGISFYHFLRDLEKDFDNKKDQLVEKLSETAKLIFNKNNLTCGITIEKANYATFQKCLANLIDSLETRDIEPVTINFEQKAKNEGLMTPSKVQYVAKGYSYIKMGYKYTGVMQVAKTIANYDYLWNRVRVQGGAYGVSAQFTKSGALLFSSYRDPNLKKTLTVYDEFTDFLENFEADDRELTKYILGTMSSVDSPLTPQMKGDKAQINYFCNITQEIIQKERNEILSTTTEKIKELAPLVKDVTSNNFICVVGGEGKIKQNKELFNNLVNVF